MMAENLITQAELESFAPDLDLSTFSQTTISGMISRASKIITQYCDVEGFFKVAVTGERDRALISPNGDMTISFRRRPVQDGDIQAIRLVGVGMSQSLTLEDDGNRVYFIPSPKTYVIYPSNYLISMGRGLLHLDSSDLFYEVDYTGGYATDIANLPEDLKEACTLYVRDMVARKYNPSGAQSFTQGRVSMSFGYSSGRSKSALVSAAEDILDSGGYARKVI
jgi:hypothetical protein